MSGYLSGDPARMGRRVWARLIDLALSVGISISFQAALLAALLADSQGAALAVVGLFVGWVGYSLWAILARAALPGQLLLGLHHVDAVTGQRAGGRTFLKYLIQGFTFGLAFLITPLSIHAPNRSWFDRMAGVTLIDESRTAPTAALPAQVAAPPTGWQGEESHLTQLGQAAPQDQGVLGGMIQSVPFEGSRPATPVVTPLVVERSAPVVVETPPAASARQPVSSAAVVPVATLDTGESMPVRGTMILGRAPRQSDGLGQASLIVVSDQSISANHLALGAGPGGPWVMDLKSTNGSWVEQDGAEARRLEPLARVPLSPGAVVKFGRRSFVVGAP